MVRSVERNVSRRVIVERHTWLERVTHLIHLITMLILLITGLKIYFGWEFMAFQTARTLHMIAVPFFLVANWILVPYNIFSCKGERCSFRDRIDHFKESYMFGKGDVERLIDIIKNFFGKRRYPDFTIYDKRKEHYVTKLHPLLKILIVFEGMAILLVAATGVVLYNLNWVPFGLPIAAWILYVTWYFASFFNANALELLRLLHLLACYWFVFEIVVHVGILELDPDVWKYHKAIFWSGKEDLSDRHFVKVIGEIDQKVAAEEQ